MLVILAFILPSISSWFYSVPLLEDGDQNQSAEFWINDWIMVFIVKPLVGFKSLKLSGVLFRLATRWSLSLLLLLLLPLLLLPSPLYLDLPLGKSERQIGVFLFLTFMGKVTTENIMTIDDSRGSQKYRTTNRELVAVLGSRYKVAWSLTAVRPGHEGQKCMSNASHPLSCAALF